MIRLTLVVWGHEVIRTAPLTEQEANERKINWKLNYGKNVRILEEKA